MSQNSFKLSFQTPYFPDYLLVDVYWFEFCVLWWNEVRLNILLSTVTRWLKRFVTWDRLPLLWDMKVCINLLIWDLLWDWLCRSQGIITHQHSLSIISLMIWILWPSLRAKKSVMIFRGVQDGGAPLLKVLFILGA